MKTAQEIITVLTERIVLLQRLGDMDVPGFGVVVGPEGDPILVLNLGSNINAAEFYKDLAGNLVEASKSLPGSAIGMPGRR